MKKRQNVQHFDIWTPRKMMDRCFAGDTETEYIRSLLNNKGLFEMCFEQTQDHKYSEQKAFFKMSVNVHSAIYSCMS